MSTELTTRTDTPATLAEHMEFARVATAGGPGNSILPDVYRGNPANVLIAVNLGAAMGLTPAESLYRISVIKGKPSAGAELIAANVRKAGHKLRVQGDETSCTATIIRADDPGYPFTVTRDLAWAKGMGLAGNDNYKRQPGTMLQWRAITAVARLACPEALYGVTYTPDEAREISPSDATVPDAAQVEFTARKIEEPEPTGAADLATLFAVMADKRPDLKGPDALRYCALVVGRDDIKESSDLTEDEITQVIEALEAEPSAAAKLPIGGSDA